MRSARMSPDVRLGVWISRAGQSARRCAARVLDSGGALRVPIHAATEAVWSVPLGGGELLRAVGSRVRARMRMGTCDGALTGRQLRLRKRGLGGCSKSDQTRQEAGPKNGRISAQGALFCGQPVKNLCLPWAQDIGFEAIETQTSFLRGIMVKVAAVIVVIY